MKVFHYQSAIESIYNNDLDALKSWLPTINLAYDNSYLLRLAVSNHKIDLIKLLIPKSNPDVLHCRPLQIALRAGYDEAVELLRPVTKNFIYERHSRHNIFMTEDLVTIGCITNTWGYWAENIEEIGRYHVYTDEEIDEVAEILTENYNKF